MVFSRVAAVLIFLLTDNPNRISIAHYRTSAQAITQEQIMIQCMPKTCFVPSRASSTDYSRQSIAKPPLIFASNDNAMIKGNEVGGVSLKPTSSIKKGIAKKNKSTTKTKSGNNRSKKKKQIIKGRIKKQSAKKKNKQKQSTKKSNSRTNDSPQTASDDDGTIYIQFSRVFQRHVVHQRHPNDENTGDAANPHIGSTTADKVLQSFEFLDEAVESFPKARVLAPTDLPFPPPSCAIVYPDDDDTSRNRLLVSRGRLIDSNIEQEECETTIAGMGLWTLCELEYGRTHPTTAATTTTEGTTATVNDKDGNQYQQAQEALRTLLQLVSSESSFTAPRHFFNLDPRRIAMRGHTSKSITLNHARIINLLSSGIDNANRDGKPINSVGLAMDSTDVAFVLQNFPQLCLYDCGELESLIRFLLQPLPKDGSIPSVAIVADRGDDGRANVDWPSLAEHGYGAGITVNQATSAIRMMPELLALYYEDSRKPSRAHMYRQMNQNPVPPKLIDEATIQLNLEGADASDAYTFAHLRSLGVSWSQLRILLSSLPLWTTNNLEPGWELMQKGPVRSILKRPALDYLRQRLQVGPGDIYRLLKTHTRMSTYDASNNMLPKLDTLQAELKLSNRDTRKLILRMPSLIGMGMAGLHARLDFFTKEANMTMDDVKEAVMKQPSLLQYGVSSSLRPKLNFLLDELGISESSIGRIIKSAPAIMGLSLTDNLRPKAVSLMQLCSFDQHGVGDIVSTSPQILLLSQKSKIEPTIKFLSSALMLSEPKVGQLILQTPRILQQGLETSLARKIEMLTDMSNSREAAVAIIHKNPALLVTSNAVLEDRIERCPRDTDIAKWLQPKSQRNKQPRYEKNSIGDQVISSSDAAFNSLTRIFHCAASAAQELCISKSVIHKACKSGMPIDGNYLYSLSDPPLAHPSKAKMSHHAKTIPISIFCSGGTYPSDSADIARGQSRTGGLAIQVFTDGSIHDRSQFLKEFSAAARSCFGIHVPRNDQDESILIAVFPLVNPSLNRCDIFSCAASLMILEAYLATKRNEKDTLYDIKIYTQSNYAWKFVKSKDRLAELGSYFTSQEMLSRLNMAGYLSNIDILNPLARSFSRLNGHAEPLESTHWVHDHANVDFLHSMDEITLINGGLSYVRRLHRQAKYAAMWQYSREKKLV